MCTKTLKEISQDINVFIDASSLISNMISESVDSVHSHIFFIDDTEIVRGVQMIIQQFNLNDDQAFAFQVIIDQIIERAKIESQLQMNIFKERDINKSQL